MESELLEEVLRPLRLGHSTSSTAGAAEVRLRAWPLQAHVMTAGCGRKAEFGGAEAVLRSSVRKQRARTLQGPAHTSLRPARLIAAVPGQEMHLLRPTHVCGS
jgi:hypothetical protein